MPSRSRTLLRLQRTLRIAAAWSIVALLTALFESNVLQEHGVPDHFADLLREHLLRSLLVGLIGGAIYLFVLRPRLRSLSFAQAFAIMAALVLCVLIGAEAVASALAEGTGGPPFADRVFRKPFLGRFLFWTLLTGATMMAVRISDQYGSGGAGLLLGRYAKPKQEQRIFLFFDMRSSTSIAEELGHVRFFSLLNDVYADITDPVLDTRGEVYQYVGDEVSVTWRLQRGLKEQRCLECFFRIREKLQQRAEHYRKAYGLVPEFKAGLHCGPVTAGEVGLVKKEPIFSGDAVNTAARIQNSCNRLGVDLLVSQDVLDLMKLPEHKFVRRAMGEIALQGKKKAIRLWTIERKKRQ